MKPEIGSSARADPYSKRALKTYIQEYLEKQEMEDAIAEYELEEVVINVLAIERTFLDKAMSVKRHAICGTLGNKVRHIYDVTREDIREFLKASEELKALLRKKGYWYNSKWKPFIVVAGHGLIQERNINTGEIV